MTKKLNILIAPNSMKGSIDAFDFADIVESAFVDCSTGFITKKVPVADGGDFTGEILKQSLKAKSVECEVVGPLGKKVNSKYAISGDVAIIEMADASGMKLCELSELDPLKASSYGTGQLINDAIKKGCSQIFLAIGGSATVDGGIGMMEALGYSFLDKNGNVITGNGAGLSKICSLKSTEFKQKLTVKIICDVDNPLLGDNGAAAVFAPQKGATSEMVEELEKGLKNWADLLQKETNRDYRDIEGAGAAGGMSLPLMAFFNAEIVAGADFVLSQLNFAKHVDWADIVLTGEGKIDSQTLNNKAPYAVAKVARKFNKPVFAIGGKVEKEASGAFDGIFSLASGPMSLEYAMSNSQALVYETSYELAKVINRLTNL